MTTILTSSEEGLRDSVMQQLSASPELDATLVGISAKDGVVTLSGYVDTYAARLAAERIARRVYGVRGVANELVVRLSHERVDPEIAKDALQALNARIGIPPEITVTVRDGYITLGGTVEWMYQKDAAERAVRYLRGVRGVFNRVAVTPTVVPKQVQKRIVQALHRHADLDARRIHVEADGATVTLGGRVRSWIEKDEAERAAWTAPGVAAVHNNIMVVP